MNSHYSCYEQNSQAAIILTQLNVQPTIQVRTSGVKNSSWQIKADPVHAMALLMCHTHYTLTQRETPVLMSHLPSPDIGLIHIFTRLHKNFVIVLYFSVINVLCEAGGDACFAPRANLVSDCLFFYALSQCDSLLVTGSYQDIRVWDTHKHEELLRITVPNMTCHAVEVQRDGKSIVSGEYAW